MRYALGILIIILLALPTPCPAVTGGMGPDPVSVGPDFYKKQIGRNVQFLVDPTNKLTISQVSEPSMERRFKSHNADTFGFGFDTSAYWYRFRLEGIGGKKPENQLMLAITRPLVTEVDLFVPVEGKKAGEFRHLRAGFKHHGAPDDLGNRVPVLALPTDMRYGPHIYLRVRTKAVFYSITLFSAKAYTRYTNYVFLFFGLTTGSILAVLLYNLAMAIVLRDKVYWYYCIYMALVNCYMAFLSGWPLGLGLNPEILMSGVLRLFACTFFAAMTFSRAFLATKGDHPVIDRVFLFFMLLSGVDFVFTFIDFDLANKTAYLLGVAAPLAVIACAAVRWRQGYIPARYYLVAWSVLMGSALIYSASNFGLTKYSFVLYNFASIGAAAEAILLSFALADRVRVLRVERKKLKEQERRLTELSIKDELTGLYNKRWFSSKLRSEIEHCRRLDQPLSLMVLDVDHFKRFNDAHGHAAGDKMLAELGVTIDEAIRQNDIPCRYGGEEFVVILPGTSGKEAMAAAERLRKSFASKRVPVSSYGQAGAAVSIGVAQLDSRDTPDTLFERADQALYQAKQNGRNQVAAHSFGKENADGPKHNPVA